jgi:hypothetical protein
MLDIVTVTCNKDCQDIVRQAKSIDRNLKGVRHWVIINETTKDGLPFQMFKWQELLQPLYKNNELRLLVTPFPTNCDGGGYFTQQLCKLWIWQLIKDDYMVLDSKSFFLKPCTLNEWDHISHGTGHRTHYNSPHPASYRGDWQRTIETYYNILNKPIPVDYFQLSFGVPFIFRNYVMETVTDWDLLINLFITTVTTRNILPSEFLLYSILCPDLKSTLKIRHALLMPEHSWKDFGPTVKKWEDPEILVGSIHRSWMNNLTNRQKLIVDQWLSDYVLNRALE